MILLCLDGTLFLWCNWKNGKHWFYCMLTLLVFDCSKVHIANKKKNMIRTDSTTERLFFISREILFVQSDDHFKQTFAILIRKSFTTFICLRPKRENWLKKPLLQNARSAAVRAKILYRSCACTTSKKFFASRNSATEWLKTSKLFPFLISLFFLCTCKRRLASDVCVEQSNYVKFSHNGMCGQWKREGNRQSVSIQYKIQFTFDSRLSNLRKTPICQHCAVQKWCH